MKNLFRIEIRTRELKVEFRKDREERRRFPKEDSLSLVFLLLQKDIYTQNCNYSFNRKQSSCN